jgi:hypothetical protein
MQRGAVPGSFGAARPPLTSLQWRQHQAKEEKAKAAAAQQARQHPPPALTALGQAGANNQQDNIWQAAAQLAVLEPSRQQLARQVAKHPHSSHSAPANSSLANSREWAVNLWKRLPCQRQQQQLQPGNVRFKGVQKSLWTKRAHNFLQLVRAAGPAAHAEACLCFGALHQ